MQDIKQGKSTRLLWKPQDSQLVRDLTLSSTSLRDRKDEPPTGRKSVSIRGIKTITELVRIEPGLEPNEPGKAPARKNLKFNKVNVQQDIIRKFLTRVSINIQTNISFGFRKIRNPQMVELKEKPVNKKNKWYIKATKIMALNSKINTQKAIWRLQHNVKVADERSYLKFIDLVVLPQQEVSYEPQDRALRSLNSLIKHHSLLRAIKKFLQNKEEKAQKSRYLRKAVKAYRRRVKSAFERVRSTPCLRKIQKWYIIQDHLKGFLSQTLSRRLREVFLEFKNGSLEGALKKNYAAGVISNSTTRKLSKSMIIWWLYTERLKQGLRQRQVTSFFQIVHEKEQKSFGVIFQGVNLNLRKTIEEALAKAMRIEEEHKNQHLSRVLLRWRAKENPWFWRAAGIMSLNLVLNSQTSLWRMAVSQKVSLRRIGQEHPRSN